MEDNVDALLSESDQNIMPHILTAEVIRQANLFDKEFISSENDIEISEDGKIALIYK